MFILELQEGIPTEVHLLRNSIQFPLGSLENTELQSMSS